MTGFFRALLQNLNRIGQDFLADVM